VGVAAHSLSEMTMASASSKLARCRSSMHWRKKGKNRGNIVKAINFIHVNITGKKKSGYIVVAFFLSVLFNILYNNISAKKVHVYLIA
jgi:hypothetical protein